MGEFRAGWAKAEIPVPMHYPLDGYIARTGGCEGQCDSLFVRVLVFEQGKMRAGVCVADLLSISNSWAARFRSRLAAVLGTRPEGIIFAATHTHSAPHVDTCPFEFSPACAGRAREQKLMSAIERIAEDALRQAAANLAPARISFARIAIRGVASDRNRPRQNVIQPFFLLRFESRAGSALFGAYGCHPTVLGASNRLASGDLHGNIASRLEQSAKVAAIANAAAANISTRFTRRGQSARELHRLAALVTDQVQTARFQLLSKPRLALFTREVRLPLAGLSSPPVENRDLQGRLHVVAQEAHRIRRQLALRPEFMGPSLIATISAIRLGKITVAALPFENYSDTGEFFWRRLRVIAVCYANGYWGYMPSHLARAGDYEVVSSPFSRQADGRLRKALIALAQ